MFQFLVVQLRVTISTMTDLLILKFQFLVVQLRGLALLVKSEFYMFQFLVVQLRATPNSSSVDGGSFQFLVVQLRVDWEQMIVLDNWVSIPCGTIKRCLFNAVP